MKVVQKKVRKAVSANLVLGCSSTTPRIGMTSTQGMMTLYTDMPINLLSFRAGMCTWRVSQARYAPKRSNKPWREKEKEN